MVNTLYYFAVRGRGESIRLLYHLHGEPFVDNRIDRENWPVLKAQMPLGQIPVLEVEGKKIAQSTAILRYVGNQLHRAGSNAVESARLDMIGEVVHEFTNSPGYALWPKIVLGVLPGDAKLHYKENVTADVDKYAPIIEKLLLENGNNGLFLGDRETWVDVYSAEVFKKILDYGNKDALEAYPNILNQISRIFSNANVKSYVDKRSPTPF